MVAGRVPMGRLTRLILAALLCLACSPMLHAQDPRLLETDGVRVLYHAQLESAAREVVSLYPEIMADLKARFGWELHKAPSVVLMGKREAFLRRAGNPLTVAFAVPKKNLVVIDYSKMITDPFSLRSSLGHELCHLLLHQHIPNDILPKWLDEGLAQWVSNGINEIMAGQKHSDLARAAHTGRLMRLKDLSRRFPAERRARLLAYEESRSFVRFLDRRFGRAKVVNLLGHLAHGLGIEEAVLVEFATPLHRLEEEWRDSLKSRLLWFTFLRYYLYEILFACMAIVTLYAFIRARLRRRHYAEEEEDEDETL